MADPVQPGAAFGFGTPFEEQLAFFRGKLNLPTERWDDIMQAAHDRAFIVAGAAKADLLQDLRAAVEASVAGGSVGEFRQRFEDIVARHGWTGWRGEGSAKGLAWRTRIIHQTNMATSYAAGRRRQMTQPDFAAERPFWRYVHADGVLHPRPLHLAWHNLVLTREHPFWDTHFAPNGWGCRCEVWPVKGPRAGDATEPPPGWQDIDPETEAPVGIDRGFDYAPGARAAWQSPAEPMRRLVAEKLITYPPAVAEALAADVNGLVLAGIDVARFAAAAAADPQAVQPLWLGFANGGQALKVAAGRDVQGFAILLPPDIVGQAAADHWALAQLVLNEADSLAPGDDQAGGAVVVATKRMEGQLLRATFSVKTEDGGALVLLSLVAARIPR